MSLEGPEDDSPVTLAAVADAHVPAILRWFEAPHIRRWWGDPRVNASELIWHRKAGGASGCRVIELDGIPAGYLQWTEVGRYFSAGRHGLPDSAIDIDILIGDPELTGRGIGTRALAPAIEEIRRAGPPPLIALFVSTGNKGAIRSYEKLGFAKVRTVNDPGLGQSWMMTLEPAR